MQRWTGFQLPSKNRIFRTKILEKVWSNAQNGPMASSPGCFASSKKMSFSGHFGQFWRQRGRLLTRIVLRNLHGNCFSGPKSSYIHVRVEKTPNGMHHTVLISTNFMKMLTILVPIFVDSVQYPAVLSAPF